MTIDDRTGLSPFNNSNNLMEMPINALNWFEIPTVDFDRAKSFYNAIFDFEMPVVENGDGAMGFLLHEQGKGVGGAIIKGGDYRPSQDGPVVYLNGGSDLQTILDRVAAAGGTIVKEKTQISIDHGYYAFFLDTEGNRLGLHSNN
jgi:uncharacterized protein